MDMIGIALLVFSCVLLIVSVYYIMTTTRHKERMAMIDRGMDPNTIKDERLFLEALKFGLVLIAGGIGFFIGVLLEDAQLFSSKIELPLYFAPIFVLCGISLILFYKMFGKRYKN